MNKEKIKRIYQIIKVAMLSICFFIFNNALVFAESKVETKSADDVANMAVDKLLPILKAFGGLCVLGGVAIVGFKLIFANKNPDKRAETMSGLMWTGIGAFIVGSAMLVAGFLWGLGADNGAKSAAASMLINYF